MSNSRFHSNTTCAVFKFKTYIVSTSEKKNFQEKRSIYKFLQRLAYQASKMNIGEAYIEIDLLKRVIQGVSFLVYGDLRQGQQGIMGVHIIEGHALRYRLVFILQVLGSFVHNEPKMTEVSSEKCHLFLLQNLSLHLKSTFIFQF